MTSVVEQARADASAQRASDGGLPPAPVRRQPPCHSGQPARTAGVGWPATRHTREQVWSRLNGAPFVSDKPNSQYICSSGLTALLDWLHDQSGDTWQQRWLASGADTAGSCWRELPAAWLCRGGQQKAWRQSAVSAALIIAICGEVIRPSLAWMITNTFGRRKPGGEVEDAGGVRVGVGQAEGAAVQPWRASHDGPVNSWFFRILPLALRGKSARTTTSRGTLKFASLSLQ